MGSQGSPRRNEGLCSPTNNDRYAQRSPKRYSSDRQSLSYRESIDHSFRDPNRSERRSRSRERSPLSASHHHILNHDLSPAGRGDIRRRGGPEWKSRSPADRDRERRTKEAEEYMVSRGFKAPNSASRHHPDGRTRQHGMLHFLTTTLHFTALKSMPITSLGL
jgi:hypothetical protein